ncbi:MAG: disulfide bond formation protein [Actinobacteria bacterium HGW-Actinobacteria-2]|nr:MAG: disulfide bond formation protein [Actinobacteria bacterium HGW-Actinobacteria-2]
MAVFLLVVIVTQQVATPGSTGGAVTPSSNAAGQTMAEKVARAQADDPMAWGDPKAPVVIVQWTDFRCPFCAAFAKDTLPTLFTQYIDTGKVRFELHDAALFGDQSVDAAVAARAAGAQGKYHEFMTALYAAAPDSGHPDLPKETLIGFAKTAGVPDMTAFAAALDDPALRKQVTDATASAQKLGVNSVPFFVVGNQVVNGAQPLMNFQSAIETELAKK